MVKKIVIFDIISIVQLIGDIMNNPEYQHQHWLKNKDRIKIRREKYKDLIQTKSDIASIESKFVNKTDTCWIWIGAKEQDGYGIWRNIRAHRLFFKVYNGELHSGRVIMHTCDNPSCVNPKHLKQGTHKQNSEDRNNKNRQYKKLQPEDVKQIRELLKLGVPMKKIANRFNLLSITPIIQIRDEITHKNL